MLDGCNFGCNQILLCLAEQILYRLLTIDILKVCYIVLLLKHVFLPSHIFVLSECLCKCLDESSLIDNKLSDLMLKLLVLQLQSLYYSFFVRKLPSDVFVLRLQLTVNLLDVSLELLEPLVLPLEVPLQFSQFLLPESLLLLDLVLVVVASLG